ncbi:hypothetical protein LSTR_LSTR012624 [Laodelphax striatellus]|uniref:Cytosolic fatty-acid binding proteins domain-containing protein n=1 Tax=Laodelphax striatellus TaxID=195883 RepID=A0A482WPH6_LAOST|nr:hypothetical protein LSTR_LSTR012624 [Laodelphax striatellus]
MSTSRSPFVFLARILVVSLLYSGVMGELVLNKKYKLSTSENFEEFMKALVIVEDVNTSEAIGSHLTFIVY